MSRQSQVQWATSGVVEAPVERVWDQVLATTPGLPTAGTRAGARAPYRVATGSAGAGKVIFEIDPQRCSIAAEGEWWYRGVYAVTPHTRGSLVTYSVYNIAPGIGWWAAQFIQGPGHARDMRTQLAQRLDEIGRRLGCKAYLAD